MTLSPRLGLSYIMPQQAQKHVTANESFRRLDALVQAGVKSASVPAEPASPAEGDAYIVPAGAIGANWSAMTANSIAAFQDAQWMELAPRAGWRVWIEDIGAARVFDGALWIGEGAAGGTASFFSLGVNTTADASNKFAAKSDAALFSHDDATPGTGDARVVINKSATAKTASAVFQNNFSGRAEFGLTGDDDFTLKVSADGATWLDALTVKPDGRIGVKTTAPAAAVELHVSGEATAASLISSDDFIIAKENSPTSFAGVVAGATSSDRMVFKGTRARGTLGVPSATASGDSTFSLIGAAYDGSSARATASIEMRVDGAVSAGIAPQRIEFLTGAASSRSERMRITSAGDVGVGVAAPACKLDVDGPIRVKSLAKAALPSAASAGQIIYVSDEAGGATIAFSDGANWRRVADRAVVS
ncbi:MAG: DUF2793 domain-containing protein, partial [Pseudomonadota bacterium]